MMEQTIENVREWGKDKNLDKADPCKQLCKSVEEIGEIAAALSRNKQEDLIDAIGDTTVTLIILAMQCGLKFENCLDSAYQVIKDRKGVTKNGVFVKEEDLK